MNQQPIPKPQPLEPEHPPALYTPQELPSIRKESFAISNDYVYKRLSRSFQRIKKMRNDAPKLLEAEFNYEAYEPRLEFKRLRELYSKTSKSHLIHKRKVEKIKNAVDKVNKDVKNSQDFYIKDVDMGRVYNIKPIIQKSKTQSKEAKS